MDKNSWENFLAIFIHLNRYVINSKAEYYLDIFVTWYYEPGHKIGQKTCSTH